MDIVNRNPDEGKEREFENTGNTGNANLPHGENIKDKEEGIRESAFGKEELAPEGSEDNIPGKVAGTGNDQSNSTNPENETAGIP